MLEYCKSEWSCFTLMSPKLTKTEKCCGALCMGPGVACSLDMGPIVIWKMLIGWEREINKYRCCPANDQHWPGISSSVWPWGKEQRQRSSFLSIFIKKITMKFLFQTHGPLEQCGGECLCANPLPCLFFIIFFTMDGCI